MKRIAPLPSFERSIRYLNVHERKLLSKSLEAFNEFLMTGTAPYGFRFKKTAGSHDDVRKYLLNF